MNFARFLFMIMSHQGRWGFPLSSMARGLIQESQRPGSVLRVGQDTLSLTISETAKFVRPVYSAQFISFCSRQNCWLVKFVFLKTGVKIALGFKISPWDCFCCKPTTVSQGKFPEISDILQHAVQLLDEYWRRVCEIAAQPHFSQLSFGSNQSGHIPWWFTK